MPGTSSALCGILADTTQNRSELARGFFAERQPACSGILRFYLRPFPDRLPQRAIKPRLPAWPSALKCSTTSAKDEVKLVCWSELFAGRSCHAARLAETLQDGLCEERALLPQHRSGRSGPSQAHQAKQRSPSLRQHSVRIGLTLCLVQIAGAPYALYPGTRSAANDIVSLGVDQRQKSP